jgi:hypothetical protein
LILSDGRETAQAAIEHHNAIRKEDEMDDPGSLPTDFLVKYRAACDKLVPKLTMLRDLFVDIAAGRADWQLDYTAQCIECEVEHIDQTLKHALDRNYVPPPECDII